MCYERVWFSFCCIVAFIVDRWFSDTPKSINYDNIVEIVFWPLSACTQTKYRYIELLLLVRFHFTAFGVYSPWWYWLYGLLRYYVFCDYIRNFNFSPDIFQFLQFASPFFLWFRMCLSEQSRSIFRILAKKKKEKQLKGSQFPSINRYFPIAWAKKTNDHAMRNSPMNITKSMSPFRSICSHWSVRNVSALLYTCNVLDK